MTRNQMTINQYISGIINEVVGQELSRVDTTAPEYVSFLKQHTHGLPPKEAADYEEIFQNNVQFISDFKWCFLGIYLDYCNGRVNFPAGKVVRGIIGELVKVHYPAHYTMILNDKVCQGFISWYVIQFMWILIFPKRFDFDTLTKSGGKSPVDMFAYTNAHQFVNLISHRL